MRARTHAHTQTHTQTHSSPPEVVIWSGRGRRPATPRREPFPDPGRPLVAGACPQVRTTALRAPHRGPQGGQPPQTPRPVVPRLAFPPPLPASSRAGRPGGESVKSARLRQEHPGVKGGSCPREPTSGRSENTTELPSRPAPPLDGTRTPWARTRVPGAHTRPVTRLRSHVHTTLVRSHTYTCTCARQHAALSVCFTLCSLHRVHRQACCCPPPSSKKVLPTLWARPPQLPTHT